MLTEGVLEQLVLFKIIHLNELKERVNNLELSDKFKQELLNDYKSKLKEMESLEKYYNRYCKLKDEIKDGYTMINKYNIQIIK
jgi:hypothetical protein